MKSQDQLAILEQATTITIDSVQVDCLPNLEHTATITAIITESSKKRLILYNVPLITATIQMVLSLGLSIAAFCYGQSSIYCAFGTESALSAISAAILMWRFSAAMTHLLCRCFSKKENNYFGENIQQIMPTIQIDIDIKDITATSACTIDTEEADDQWREDWSSFWMGWLMIVSGVGVLIRTFLEIISLVATNAEDSQEKDHMIPLLWLSYICLTGNLVTGLIKGYMCYLMASRSMFIEATSSVVSVVVAGTSIVSIAKIFTHLDQILSVCVGIFFIGNGIYTVFQTIGSTILAERSPPKGEGYFPIVNIE